MKFSLIRYSILFTFIAVSISASFANMETVKACSKATVIPASYSYCINFSRNHNLYADVIVACGDAVTIPANFGTCLKFAAKYRFLKATDIEFCGDDTYTGAGFGRCMRNMVR